MCAHEAGGTGKAEGAAGVVRWMLGIGVPGENMIIGGFREAPGNVSTLLW